MEDEEEEVSKEEGFGHIEHVAGCVGWFIVCLFCWLTGWLERLFWQWHYLGANSLLYF